MAAEILSPNSILLTHLDRSRQLGYRSLAAVPARLLTPLSQSLSEEINLRRNRVDQLVGETLIPSEEVSERVTRLCQTGRFEPTLRHVLDFSIKETVLFQPLTQLGFESVVRSFFNVDWAAGIPVAWNCSDLSTDGGYDYEKGVLMKYGPPVPEVILTNLARTGLVDSRSLILTHELVHSKQAARKKKRGSWYLKHREFMEVHAYISEGRPQFTERNRLKRHVLTAVGYDKKLVYPGVDPRKVDFAIWAVDRLLALGFTHDQICTREANLGNWNQRRSLYRKLCKTVESGARKLQLSPTDLDVLIEGNSLVHLEHRHMVRLASQEILKKAA